MVRGITGVLSETGFEGLDRPPHVVSQLTDIMIGSWQPTSADLEDLLAHLVECIYCQLALGALIALELDSDPSDEDDKILRKLLTQLTEIIHKTHQDDLAAYIEILKAQGEDEANSKFPVLSEHLKRCSTCQSTVEGTRVQQHRAE